MEFGGIVARSQAQHQTSTPNFPKIQKRKIGKAKRKVGKAKRKVRKTNWNFRKVKWESWNSKSDNGITETEINWKVGIPEILFGISRK